eukprot:gnl/Trimastix_PCT/207.p1 GENE.gnl/Trimastix_PCT/207~~gnl/Trimastix_PCT/207.p1  ORF type:complete len:1246 (+),score=513.85 gnl/Trimastix_PCT/207:34-3771(+)
MEETELFPHIGSEDFLGFEFNGKTYNQQIQESLRRTGKICAVKCTVRTIGSHRVVWLAHDFGFLGGSLGCAEGEKLTLGFEYAARSQLPVVVESRTGGARMQEGLSSLMQMAKVSVAVDSFRSHGLPYICIFKEPTYGGVSASYAMQADVRIGIKNARIGFAGPSVILNTMYDKKQAAFDENCPRGFQSATFLKEHGQLDMVLEKEDEVPAMLDRIFNVFMKKFDGEAAPLQITTPLVGAQLSHHDYVKARELDRYQSQDIIEQVLTNYVDLEGDGRMGTDPCIHGGIALFQGRPVVVVGMWKGHTPGEFSESNYGMPSPHGYRLALRMFNMAEHFGFPVVTLVDTVGALPSFAAEQDGQSEAIATNLARMSSLKVPVVTIVVGEGGSGGALGIAMGNRVGMLSRGYYGVISPEGAASILGRYRDEAHKAQQFPVDCQTLATRQRVYADHLKELGLINEIIWEKPDVDGGNEDYQRFDVLKQNVASFLARSLHELSAFSPTELVADRYQRFRSMGRFRVYTESEHAALVSNAQPMPPRQRPKPLSARFVTHIADHVINASHAIFKGHQPNIAPVPVLPVTEALVTPSENAKSVLDRDGPDAVVDWIREQSRVLITDTTIRDAHQSLIATRMRTADMIGAAEEMSRALHDAFSIEMWGGATFDVCFRFLKENPWERLRELRKKIPNVCFQMLLRGSNAVGYSNYADNVVQEFVRLAAENGIDVFRIFDCFNQLDKMAISLEAVKRANKIAEVAICFTGNFLDSEERIYTLDYYKDLAQRITDMGAHIIGIKDMAGLMRPQMARPFIEAMRSVTSLPLHFHTHNTSSASLATALEMADAGCEIIDLACSSFADLTAQPSLNAFLAAMKDRPRDPLIDYHRVEPLASYFNAVRTMYRPFESGMLAGTARVYDHQIPGGQYSNLLAQSKSLGIWERWDEVLDMYAKVNRLFGDVVKVTPSSKVVGDMALFMLSKGLTTADIIEHPEEISFPDSVKKLFNGELGFPHHGLPDYLREKVLSNDALQARVQLPAVDFDALKTELEAKYEMSMSMEDLVSACLYPKVYNDYIAHCNKFGRMTTYLPTPVFFYGMAVGDQHAIRVPAQYFDGDLAQALEVALPENGDAEVAIDFALTRLGPENDASERILEFLVNGAKFTHKIACKPADTTTVGVKADLTDKNQVSSPVPGVIARVYVSQGDTVQKGTKLVELSAMKMDVLVTAPHDGVVAAVDVKVADRVLSGIRLATVTPSE